MAIVKITPQKLTNFNTFLTAAAKTGLTTAVDATAGAYFEMSDRDDKCLVLLENVNASAAKTATIKAGNGIQGNSDISISIASGKYTAVVVESGRFKNVSGDNKGRVLITGSSADIQVAVFVLP